MATLFARIREAVRAGRYVFSDHADNAVADRGFENWQIAAGLEEARLLRVIRDAKPNPKVEVEQILSDGSSYKAVWSWLAYTQHAKLVTVHFFDR